MQNVPQLVAPYCGQSQPTVIPVPATIAYKYIDREEGPWAMIPYAQLYPPDPPAPSVAFLPPPIRTSDLWSAMQTFPL
jgi:hypothetical protein